MSIGTFNGRIVILGSGQVSSNLISLLYRKIRSPNVTVITDDISNKRMAEQYGAALEIQQVTKDNFRSVLDTNLYVGDFLINFSPVIDKTDIIIYCLSNSVFYFDTECDVSPHSLKSESSEYLRTLVKSSVNI